MATRDDLVAGNERRPSRRAGGLSPELIAILAVGVALAGVMLTMMTVMMGMMNSFDKELSAVREEMREEVGELRAGQVELRERMVRVESKLDVLAGDWPPKEDRGPARQETSPPRG